LERVRRNYGFHVLGYVVMPEHVHLLVTEPERASLSVAIQMLKQMVSQKLPRRDGTAFWQVRYYDFNVWSTAKRIEKLKYIHRNPVKRRLVSEAGDWKWSSYQHYAEHVEGTVEIASPWNEWRKRQTKPTLSSATAEREGWGTHIRMSSE
jgi:putative transposase